jgi:DNA-binding NtrC family response regulator
MNKAKGTILIVDDDEFVILSIKLLLEPHFESVLTSNNPERIPSLINRSEIDVVLLDMNFRQGDTTGNQGMFWLKNILGASPETQVILMTAFADISVAVEAIRLGALDFIVKPWENEKLIATVKAANTVSQEKKKVRTLKSQQRSLVSAINHQHDPMIGDSSALTLIRNSIAKVAPTEAEVLIHGQNGTGKEVIAREIHRQSKRSDGIFMAVDLGSLSETLFESELSVIRKAHSLTLKKIVSVVLKQQPAEQFSWMKSEIFPWPYKLNC